MRSGKGGVFRKRTIKGKKRVKMRHVDLFLCRFISSSEICVFMMGCQRQQLDRDSCSDPSRGSSYEGVALAVPSALNHISHLISPLFLIYHLLSSPSFTRSSPPPPPPPTSSPSTRPQLRLHHIHFSLSSLFFRLPTQSKVTPDLRLPLPPSATLNNEAEQ